MEHTTYQTEDLKRTFASNLRNLMSANELTQSELASVVGISQSYVSKMCKGELPPSLEVALAIADMFDTSVSELIGEVEAGTYENSRLKAQPVKAKPIIDKVEFDSMKYLYGKGTIPEGIYYNYLEKTIKEVIA